jgi:hypothetical protein
MPERRPMATDDPRPFRFDATRHLSNYQEILGLPRETLPQSTAEATRRALHRAAAVLRLDLVATEGVAPIFLLLPPVGAEPSVALYATWHAESAPVLPAALEGAERLALAATLAALEATAAAGSRETGRAPINPAIVVAPAASHGSLPLAEALAGHRERLRARTAFWVRIAPTAPRRRRVFLGSRGRAVVGLWGEGPNPYAIRDALLDALTEEAYGPRPLDFELLRKLAASEEAKSFLEETIADSGAVRGEGEARLRNALFAPRGQVMAPAYRHPDRPAAWIVFETSEGMEAADIRARVESLAGGARVEMAEALPWDRIGIHHPSVRAAIAESKERSAGPEFWPMAPWTTPSGAFTRALGLPLLEWAVPLPPGGAVRPPTPPTFEPIVLEIAQLLRRTVVPPASSAQR